MAILIIHKELLKTDYWPVCKELLEAEYGKMEELTSSSPNLKRYFIEVYGLQDDEVFTPTFEEIAKEIILKGINL